MTENPIYSLKVPKAKFPPSTFMKTCIDKVLSTQSI